mgnify:CR=1 FL=1
MMDSGFLTAIFTLVGVLLGFILTQIATVRERKRENIKKIRFFNQQLKMILHLVRMLNEDIANDKDYFEIQPLYSKFNIPLKIAELSGLLQSIDLSDGENFDIYMNFEVLRSNLDKLDKIFLKYGCIEFAWDESFYFELENVCKDILGGVAAISSKIEVVYLDYSYLGNLKMKLIFFYYAHIKR